MGKLYSSPLRVYLCLGVLAAVGIYSSMRLPVSLFPNTNKPEVSVSVSYGGMTTPEFVDTYGISFESLLRSIKSKGVEVEKVRGSYSASSVHYQLTFKWGVEPDDAYREVRVATSAFAARLPKESRDSVNVYVGGENNGFLAVSFFSASRSLDAVYDILEPVLTPRITRARDAAEALLWNPSSKEITVELVPEKMASLGLVPRDVESAIDQSLRSYGGGSVTLGARTLNVQMPKLADSLDSLGSVPVPTPAGGVVHLSDIARVDFGPKTDDGKTFKTSGAPSLILWATPKAGGNIKRMAEEILASVREVMPGMPGDIQYRVLVDPSEFIRSAIDNVFHEVLIGAGLAVCILFVFIGSFRNVVTAAIEIPLSIVLAFILMRASGMNLNIISLGGLALSAGMNVDASVVVMENIFRHLEKVRGPLTFASRLKVITAAVAEVRFAILASTVASLVVFVPLAFTAGLSNAVLGDLAKTVVFSHGLSALVALVLVPTVRLHLMSRAGGGVEAPHRSPFEGALTRLEVGYSRALTAYLARPRLRLASYAGLVVLLVALATWVLPRLPKEIIGKPDTEMIFLGMRTSGQTLARQMEAVAEETEARVLERFGDSISYTFTQIGGPNRAWIMARLVDKRQMERVWKAMEAEFANTSRVKYYVGPWNPAELPIPDPPQLRIVIRGPNAYHNADVARALSERLEQEEVFPRIWTDPSAERTEDIVLRPHVDLWLSSRKQGSMLQVSDLTEISSVATRGKYVGSLPVSGKNTSIMMRYPQDTAATPEDLAALPMGLAGRIVPLSAFADVRTERMPPTVLREDERELFVVYGKKNESDSLDQSAALKRARAIVADWQSENRDVYPSVSVEFEDAEKDLTDAIDELSVAVALSIALVFITLVIQFGSVVDSLLVLVAIPLGFVGVLLSLWVFGSTLSLNSVLGVILLNGISVANSIILVDFMQRLSDGGMKPLEAAIEAARKRLRPILITSLTTILGMMPIALGFGEGGRILQPLGIAVTGGLWVSMLLTLFLVPALKVAALRWRSGRAIMPAGMPAYPERPIEVTPVLPPVFRTGLVTRAVGKRRDGERAGS